MDMVESDRWEEEWVMMGEKQWEWSVLLPPSLHYFQTYPIATVPYIPAPVTMKKLEQQHPSSPIHTYVILLTYLSILPQCQGNWNDRYSDLIMLILFSIPPFNHGP